MFWTYMLTFLCVILSIIIMLQQLNQNLPQFPILTYIRNCCSRSNHKPQDNHDMRNDKCRRFKEFIMDLYNKFWDYLEKDAKEHGVKETNRPLILKAYLQRKMNLKPHFESFLNRTDFKNRPEMVSFLAKSLNLVTWGFAGLTLAGTIGFDIRPIIGGFGILGVVSGLALKDIASNYFSGVQILVTHPFHIGNEVILTDKLIQGRVINIDLTHVHLQADDGTLILLPHKSVVSSPIYLQNPNSNEIQQESEIKKD